MRRLLCIPKAVVETANVEVSGAVYKEAVQKALSVGIESFSPALRDRKAAPLPR